MSEEKKEKKNNPTKAVLVNLDVSIAEAFYRLAKSGKFFDKKNPTAVARELIHSFVDQHQSAINSDDDVTDDVTTESNA